VDLDRRILLLDSQIWAPDLGTVLEPALIPLLAPMFVARSMDGQLFNRTMLPDTKGIRTAAYLGVEWASTAARLEPRLNRRGGRYTETELGEIWGRGIGCRGIEIVGN